MIALGGGSAAEDNVGETPALPLGALTGLRAQIKMRGR